MYAYFDTECFPNYWLLKLKVNGRVFTFSTKTDLTLSQASSITRLFDLFTAVSFNGKNYDVPMIACAISGYTVEQLKAINDKLIVEKCKHWELNLPKWEPRDHIDVMEVCPGAGSQKVYAGRIHHKTMRDLPFEPTSILSDEQIPIVDEYCENDLGVLEAITDELAPHLRLREKLSARYNVDVRSKSDAQVAECVLKSECEKLLGRRIYKEPVDWNLQFRYTSPTYIKYKLPQLTAALDAATSAVFGFGPKGTLAMPKQLEGLLIPIGQSVYKMGIGGLHTQEKNVSYKSSDDNLLIDSDVASYYPELMLRSGAYPKSLGNHFLKIFRDIKEERITNKQLAKKLKSVGGVDYENAQTADAGMKIMINGTFGKTGSPYSILFAPEMLIQTTLTGQLSLLLLIEWLEREGIPVVSANTDGIVINCPKIKLNLCSKLIQQWENTTGLQMEQTQYRAIYSRDVNNYFAVKFDGEVKRKGEYSKAGLNAKKNPGAEICSDAVAEFLAKGTPIANTIACCNDMRKFVVVQKVEGGAIKLRGDGPKRGELVRDIIPTLERFGWIKVGRKWFKDGLTVDAHEAHAMCYAPQSREYVGKVIRWYYSNNCPGPIVYAKSGNTVSLTHGAKPCMQLPDNMPMDIDYNWYIANANSILTDIAYR